MPVSKITISSESIVDLAKNTIVPSGIKCDWLIGGRDACPVILGCWELLKEHYLRHAHVQKKQAFGRTCHLPRCNSRFHSTVGMLQNHIKIAHMPRVGLSCPVNDCKSSDATYRHFQQLTSHFRAEHIQLDGITIEIPSKLLKPSWQPFYPSQNISPPPALPLPDNPMLRPGCVLLYPTKPSTFPWRLQGSSSILGLPPSASPRKPQRQIPTKEDKDKDIVELETPEFGDLSRLSGSDITADGIQELVVWRRPGLFDTDMSRPQRMRDLPIEDPPLSILYEVFARRVDELGLQASAGR